MRNYPTAGQPLVAQQPSSPMFTVGDTVAVPLYQYPAVGSVPRLYNAKMSDILSILDFGGATIEAQFAAAIAALPATGGTIDARALTGAQNITGKITIAKPNVTILFGAATYTLSGVGATQVPVGVNWLVTAANVWLVSEGRNTVFKMDAGAQADAIGFVHGTATLGGVVGIELDGNKANNVSQIDDTFQSGIAIIAASAQGVTVEARITIEDCRIHDFCHYGILTYGDMSGGNLIHRNHVFDNGKNDALGTGDGLYINLGTSRCLISGNYLYGNNRNGIRFSSAGVAQYGNKARGNLCYSNVLSGILADEELNLGCVVNVGQSALEITGNLCYSNGDSGIFLTTNNNVGVIVGALVSGNQCFLNAAWGVRLEGNAHATSNTRECSVYGNECCFNTQRGITIGANVLDVLMALNTLLHNTAGTYTDGATRTTIYGNKTNITDAFFRAPTGITTDGADVHHGAGYADWSEAGVRTWFMRAIGGNLEATSGDGAGSFRMVGTGGLDSDGPMLLRGPAVAAPAAAAAIGNGTQGTVGAAGGASALPATPLGYLLGYIGAQKIAIPYYLPV